MLRHLSPEPKRSTMTRSARPSSFSAAASAEPINPPPPVITSMYRSCFADRIIDSRSGNSRGIEIPVEALPQLDLADHREFREIGVAALAGGRVPLPSSFAQEGSRGAPRRGSAGKQR